MPAPTRRHFPGGPPDLAAAAGRGEALARLLEDGDRGDCAWLLAELGPARVAAWLARHGARRLSRRSRAFWFRLLGLGEPPQPAAGEALWPLA